jgi:hypothetical protein
MGEALFGVLQLIGWFTGKWLLPGLSGGRLLLMPRELHQNRFDLPLIGGCLTARLGWIFFFLRRSRPCFTSPL